MPPQLTNSTCETEGDAARRGLDLSMVLSLLRRYWRVFQQQRLGQRVTLQDLSDRELMDIGLTRGEVDYFTPERAIDTLRNRAADLWGRGGM
ncbi:DUF1127 domain-containing protein [Bradyrhizobium sp. SEMIA]|uniref:DUF1127 domain-containing protein n=1 Tax=Bradyrhizobium sp. SEMIA TaxID=2597515 RepID=UPI0018A4169D|nr:DUF1127 domain-containing protein [Bradyrhizobium sp. SEMIA]QOG17240.1 DUF1127 domain-containing protein [Bradyrhizobium sp. SEMIA]